MSENGPIYKPHQLIDRFIWFRYENPDSSKWREDKLEG